jgi:hypothetical protein
MSCVAELKASSQKRHMVHLKKSLTGIRKAIDANRAPMKSCVATIHMRRVRSISTIGLQNGFITQGRYSQLVYSAMEALSIPILLYKMTDITLTAK